MCNILFNCVNNFRLIEFRVRNPIKTSGEEPLFQCAPLSIIELRFYLEYFLLNLIQSSGFYFGGLEISRKFPAEFVFLPLSFSLLFFPLSFSFFFLSSPWANLLSLPFFFSRSSPPLLLLSPLGPLQRRSWAALRPACLPLPSAPPAAPPPARPANLGRVACSAQRRPAPPSHPSRRRAQQRCTAPLVRPVPASPLPPAARL